MYSGAYNMEIPGEGDEEEYLGEDDYEEDLCKTGPCDFNPPDAGEGAEEDEMPLIPMEEVLTPADPFQLDEFMRAKAYFLQASHKSGLNLYDHLSDVIRKFLDERAPNNPVDYLEEVSMNIKRYRFGMLKKDPLQDVYDVSAPILADAKRLMQYWKAFAKWSEDKKEIEGEGLFMGGSFQNLLRLQYYLEHLNLGLPREEMFRLALGIKELSASRPQVGRLRLWGKIFGIERNYYVIEAELKFGSTEQAVDLWIPPPEVEEEKAAERTGEQTAEPQQPGMMFAGVSGGENVLDAVQTFSRAKDVVLNHDFLTAYSKTSGLPAEKQADLLPKPISFYVPREWSGEGDPEMMEFEDPDARADAMKWEGYQQELMDSFPQTTGAESELVPPEPEGSGLNRRVFYVCSDLGTDWILLPPVTPQQINASRQMRWFLTGNLNAKVRTLPPFPGREGHYLKALLVRITAGGMVSPKGFYRPVANDGEIPGEEDDDELDPEDEEPPLAGNDNVQPVKKYRASMKALTNPSLAFWVHHTSYILPQGRTVWWNPAASKKKRRPSSEQGSELETEDEDDEEDEEETIVPGKEVGPPLFHAISEDKAADGKAAWSLVTSSTVFPEFQVVGVRSNVWTGSNVICTSKGKVSNLYLGDGLKFFPRTFSPGVPGRTAKEFRAGPELEETPDPTVEDEQAWIDKLAMAALEKAKMEDNEEEATMDEEEEDDEDEF